MKIKILLIGLLLVSTGWSQTFYMDVNMLDETWQTFDLSKIRKITFANITDIKDFTKVENIIESFRLFQNYPNPFNPSTTINYEIPQKGDVELKIFDICGRLVIKMEYPNQPAGLHKVTWNGQSFSGNKAASGFYTYTVRFNNQISSRKMLLIK